MATFTTQIRRFNELAGRTAQLGQHESDDFQGALGLTLKVLLTQLLALTLDCPVRSMEQACRSAADLIAREGWGDDIDRANVGWLGSKPAFSPLTQQRIGRRPVSERLGSLAAWKWIDLFEFVAGGILTLGQLAKADAQLSVVVVLISEAMMSVIGEVDDLSQERRDASDRLHKSVASKRAHKARKQQREPLKQELVAAAMGLRDQHLRSAAATLTLQRFFRSATEDEKKNLPTSRTLIGWLAEAGWHPRERSPRQEKK